MTEDDGHILSSQRWWAMGPSAMSVDVVIDGEYVDIDVVIVSELTVISTLIGWDSSLHYKTKLGSYSALFLNILGLLQGRPSGKLIVWAATKVDRPTC